MDRTTFADWYLSDFPRQTRMRRGKRVAIA